MAVEGKNRGYHWNSIRLRHWLETARRGGVPQIEMIVRDIIHQTPPLLDRVRDIVPGKFPEEIANSILEGVKAAASELSEELSTDS